MRSGHSSSAACKRTVSGSFHSPSGVLFTFPSRYWFTIGRQRVFSLGEWSPQFHTEFHVLGATQELIASRHVFAYRTLTFYGRLFQGRSTNMTIFDSPALNRMSPTTPIVGWVWAVPLSLATTNGISSISFPPGTEMFHFPGLSRSRYLSPFRDRLYVNVLRFTP